MLWALLHYCNLNASFINLYHDKFSINDSKFIDKLKAKFLTATKIRCKQKYLFGGMHRNSF